jgi:hypothetical protein
MRERETPARRGPGRSAGSPPPAAAVDPLAAAAAHETPGGPRRGAHYAPAIAHLDPQRSTALDFPRVAGLIEDALAALPAGEHPYPRAKAVVDELVMTRPGPWPLELIWSYWHDAMRLDDAVDVVRGLPGVPAGSVVGRLVAGMAGDVSRTTAAERAEAYFHAYGLRLDASTPPSLLREGRFAPALHTLLERASRFYRDDDDTGRVADALPLLHALADLQNLLNEQVHPALESLVRGARRDALMALYALSRPELRPLLPIHRHVMLPELWMPALDAIATLERWQQVSAGFFAQLAQQGERILLSVRFGSWPATADRDQAANWARFWRAEVQGYGLARAVVA